MSKILFSQINKKNNPRVLMSRSQVRADAIGFLEKMRVNENFMFKFSSANQSSLIASGLAVMLGSLLGWLDTFGDGQKKAWADYLNSFQQKDRLFEDEDISDVNRLPEYTKERALLHRSRHILFALATLGYKPRYDFLFLENKLIPGSIEAWMKEIDLSDFWDSANKIMDLALFLTYEAKVNGNLKAAKAVNVILDICDRNTNPETGYQDAGKSELRNAMAGAMHIYPIYFLWGRKPEYPEKVIKTTLSLQQKDGFFAYNVGSCGEDCLDYDAVNILVNFSFITDFYSEEVRQALERLLYVIEDCRNLDGGFCCHRRNENYRFGTLTTEVPIGGSSLWSTYSRLLTIAMAEKILNTHSVSKNWNLGNNIMEIWDGGSGHMKSYYNFDNLKD